MATKKKKATKSRKPSFKGKGWIAQAEEKEKKSAKSSKSRGKAGWRVEAANAVQKRDPERVYFVKGRDVMSTKINRSGGKKGRKVCR